MIQRVHGILLILAVHLYLYSVYMLIYVNWELTLIYLTWPSIFHLDILCILLLKLHIDKPVTMYDWRDISHIFGIVYCIFSWLCKCLYICVCCPLTDYHTKFKSFINHNYYVGTIEIRCMNMMNCPIQVHFASLPWCIV